MVTLEFLRSHSLFGGIMDKDLTKIRTLFKEDHFAKGDEIIKEGEPGDRLYFIHDGSVEILKKIPSSENDAQKRLAVLKKGNTFGEMELIDVEERVATVKALENTETLSLSNSDLYVISKWNFETFTIIIMNLAR